MWRAVNHKQLRELYEINKDTKEIRSKPYKVFKDGELKSINTTRIIKWNDKNLVNLLHYHYNHRHRNSWFNVNRLYDKTFSTKSK